MDKMISDIKQHFTSEMAKDNKLSINEQESIGKILGFAMWLTITQLVLLLMPFHYFYDLTAEDLRAPIISIMLLMFTSIYSVYKVLSYVFDCQNVMQSMYAVYFKKFRNALIINLISIVMMASGMIMNYFQFDISVGIQASSILMIIAIVMSIYSIIAESILAPIKSIKNMLVVNTNYAIGIYFLLSSTLFVLISTFMKTLMLKELINIFRLW